MCPPRSSSPRPSRTRSGAASSRPRQICAARSRAGSRPCSRAGDPGVMARAAPGPTVIVMVGVNGTGKTTTTAKLAAGFSGRADRAAGRGGHVPRRRDRAAQDLGRSPGLPCVAGGRRRSGRGRVRRRRGGDVPGRESGHHRHGGATAYSGRPDGRAAEGRSGHCPEVTGRPHETLLVLDGTVGQNAVQQGKLFAQAVSPPASSSPSSTARRGAGRWSALRRELSASRSGFSALGEGAWTISSVRSASLRGGSSSPADRTA